MPTAAVPASPADRTPAVVPPMLMTDAVAKDALIAWYRGEFAAANAIIDALCGHLVQIGGSEYDAVFTAIHQRRMNWIPVLQMQKYHSIADVAVELRRVTAAKMESRVAAAEKERKIVEFEGKAGVESNGTCGGVDEIVEEDDAPDSDITDSGSQDVQANPQDYNDDDELCLNHQDCDARIAQIKLTKGFSAKEPVKGHMVNVVKGLKLYENIFTEAELTKLNDFVNEFQIAGQNGELSGDTFILFNKQIKGNRRELIQFGVPIFGQIKEEDPNSNQSNNIEPIPAFLESVIDHMIQWQLLPEYKRPNSCIISFFDEGEHSQPFLKPPHLEHPLSTLLLSESTMAFGRILVSDKEGNYKGPLMLSLKEGSLLVMRGHSADMARHVMCPSSNRRVSITFFRVRPVSNQCQSPTSHPQTTAMTLWQPGMPGALNGCEPMDMNMNMMPKWGVLRAPVVMLAPLRPMVLAPKRVPRGGTGVFLPWTMGGSRKPAKHLPPRAQKNRCLALPPVESRVAESTSDSGII